MGVGLDIRTQAWLIQAPCTNKPVANCGSNSESCGLEFGIQVGTPQPQRPDFFHSYLSIGFCHNFIRDSVLCTALIFVYSYCTEDVRSTSKYITAIQWQGEERRRAKQLVSLVPAIRSWIGFCDATTSTAKCRPNNTHTHYCCGLRAKNGRLRNLPLDFLR